jgi:hypothetical protein
MQRRKGEWDQYVTRMDAERLVKISKDNIAIGRSSSGTPYKEEEEVKEEEEEEEKMFWVLYTFNGYIYPHISGTVDLTFKI